MRHAYLILAHNSWQQLYKLLQLLDSQNADFYIHIDKRAKDFKELDFSGVCKQSVVHFYSEYENFWGSYRLIESEFFLLREATKQIYDYYHLLSGTDLPIKPKGYIEEFFYRNQGKEFIHFDTDARLASDKELERRTRLYHWLQNYRKRYKSQWLNEMFTFFEHCSLGIQLLLKVDRLKHKNIKIYYGSQWFSITHEFAIYALQQKQIVSEIFHNTSCSDELVFQTLIMGSEFKNRLYIMERSNTCLSNMRLIDWKRGKNGSPYTWQKEDLEELKSSECLFARKFPKDFPDELIAELVGTPILR